jgi:UDP-N-acetylmuramyl pentapeptide phosphotransferase/UDP-N-acetylglucosamine-1-phosphate transferase
MKGFTLLGAILLILGVLAFAVPIPRTKDHDVKIGDTRIGVETQHHERVPPLLAGTLVVAGVVVLAVGARKRT